MLTATVSLDRLLQASLEAPAGMVTAVMGPSGAGKTLLLRCIAGLESARGRVALEETVWLDKDQSVPVHERGVGMVFQSPRLFEHLDVRGNLQFAASRRRSTGPSVEEAADAVGVSGLLDRSVQRLSGGEAQRVAIARALLTDARVLLFDEPVSALDRDARAEVLQTLAKVCSRAQVPVVYVTHDLDEVARLADRLVLLEDGRTTASGKLEDMLVGPLGVREDAESLLRGSAVAWDEHYRLLEVATEAGSVKAVSDPIARNQPVRVRIRARDVSLTLERQSMTSILNILPATVMDVRDQGGARVSVRLSVGDAQIVAHVSHASREALALEPGREVFAQIKSVAVLA
ncbi:MAG: molybdenum ABC transporter ATP-binding protein [Rhodothermales bacterium]|nr:molybdenum ABC transporter ATP-binding protein [Rhodothermales bacterium]MBO6780875.1 molybdenum ABC transporter ATP-binding protein [Rhodothermales bacterium]